MRTTPARSPVHESVWASARVCVWAGAVVGTLAIANTPLIAQSTWPTKAWPSATPRTVGLNVAVLDSIAGEIAAGRHGFVDRFLVIRRGHIAYDRRFKRDYDSIYGASARARGPLNQHDLNSPYNYFNPWWHPYYRRGDLHSLQSVSKTISSVIIGTAVTRGDFPSLDTPVLSFFDTTRVKHLDDRKRRLTIRHLLTMTAGFDWNENVPYEDSTNAAGLMEGSYDWEQFVIDRAMMEEPGTRFNYNSGATQLLSHIFFKATKRDIEEYAAVHLFAPLGIERWFWKRTPAGVVDTEGGLFLEARDLAKIWYLFLKDGMWDGKRVVSSEWVRMSVAPAIAVGPAPNAPRYGFKWWLYPDPRDTSRYIWSGNGFGGQFPIAFPNDDMVVVFNGWSILPGEVSLPLRKMLERLARAVVPSVGAKRSRQPQDVEHAGRDSAVAIERLGTRGSISLPRVP